MPPGPVFNWLCVASSACDIFVRAARVKASQIASEGAFYNGIQYGTKKQYKAARGVLRATEGHESVQRHSGNLEGGNFVPENPLDTSRLPGNKPDGEKRWETMAGPAGVNDRLGMDEGPRVDALASLSEREPPLVSNTRDLREEELSDTQEEISIDEQNLSLTETNSLPTQERNDVTFSLDLPLLELERVNVPFEPIDEAPVPTHALELDRINVSLEPVDEVPVSTRQLQSSKVPSSRLGRLFHYGGLAASLGYGAASEIIRRTASSGSEGSQQSVMMTEANITRLVSKLSQMRGAALKLGQFLSIQDTHVLPADVDKIFRRVQDSAHYMPDWQMEQVLRTSLGPDWAKAFTSFDRVPFAAASIGQVHTATLAADVSPTGTAARVAVKIQFPNIANSIASDLGYISLLLTAGRLLPKGLFLDRTMQVMKEELADECDYVREAGFLRAFGAPERLGGDARFKVPWVWDGSTERVLVMEHVEGTSVGEASLSRLDQSDRDDIAARIVELCLKELFEFRMMQTDPNWSNFLWNARTRRVELVDFGATRAYSKAFMDNWLHLLLAAAAEDRAACIEWSLKLGYITGNENTLMLDAHIESMTLLATPFKHGTPQPFAFGQGSRWADITAQIRATIPVMLQHRLTPPPQETYSLNRKLSGAFLLASRLGATVDTRAIWDKAVAGYRFGSEAE